MYMSMLKTTIRKERNVILFMLNEYNNRILSLPKGTIFEIHNDNKCYYYLKYRQGKKIISRYIPSSEVDEIRLKLQERKHIEQMIKPLKDDLKLANKVIGDKQ